MNYTLSNFNEELSVTRLANVAYREFNEGYISSAKKHPFRELIYVDFGTISIESESYCGVLHSKQLLIHKANESHSLLCNNNNAPNILSIGFECDVNQLDFFSQNPLTMPKHLVDYLYKIIHECRSVYAPPHIDFNTKNMKKESSYAFGADQMIRLSLEMLLIEIVRSIDTPIIKEISRASEIQTSEVYNYIYNNFCENISLDELCLLFHTNKSSLCKNFKAYYGESITHRIHRLRIRKAKELMRENKMSLTEIAGEVGFSTLHYFSEIFKKMEGHSPSEYINTVKHKLDE